MPTIINLCRVPSASLVCVVRGLWRPLTDLSARPRRAYLLSLSLLEKDLLYSGSEARTHRYRNSRQFRADWEAARRANLCNFLRSSTDRTATFTAAAYQKERTGSKGGGVGKAGHVRTAVL